MKRRPETGETEGRDCALVTSSGCAAAVPPAAVISCTRESSFDTVRAPATTLAPALARIVAKGRPSPSDAPVTTTTLPSSPKSSSTNDMAGVVSDRVLLLAIESKAFLVMMAGVVCERVLMMLAIDPKA